MKDVAIDPYYIINSHILQLLVKILSFNIQYSLRKSLLLLLQYMVSLSQLIAVEVFNVELLDNFCHQISNYLIHPDDCTISLICNIIVSCLTANFDFLGLLFQHSIMDSLQHFLLTQLSKDTLVQFSRKEEFHNETSVICFYDTLIDIMLTTKNIPIKIINPILSTFKEIILKHKECFYEKVIFIFDKLVKEIPAIRAFLIESTILSNIISLTNDITMQKYWNCIFFLLSDILFYEESGSPIQEFIMNQISPIDLLNIAIINLNNLDEIYETGLLYLLSVIITEKESISLKLPLTYFVKELASIFSDLKYSTKESATTFCLSIILSGADDAIVEMKSRQLLEELLEQVDMGNPQAMIYFIKAMKKLKSRLQSLENPDPDIIDFIKCSVFERISQWEIESDDNDVKKNAHEFLNNN